MTTCAERAPLLVARLLGVLEATDAAALASHLEACGDCRKLAERAEAAFAGGALAPERAPASLDERIFARIAREEEDAVSSVALSVLCTYCHGSLTRERAVFCASCLAPCHEDCFREHGRCSAPGCEEARFVEPTVLGERAPRRPVDAKRRRRWRRLGAVLVLGLGAGGGGIAAIVTERSSPREANATKTQAPPPAPAVELPFNPFASATRGAWSAFVVRSVRPQQFTERFPDNGTIWSELWTVARAECEMVSVVREPSDRTLAERDKPFPAVDQIAWTFSKERVRPIDIFPSLLYSSPKLTAVTDERRVLRLAPLGPFFDSPRELACKKLTFAQGDEGRDHVPHPHTITLWLSPEVPLGVVAAEIAWTGSSDIAGRQGPCTVDWELAGYGFDGPSAKWGFEPFQVRDACDGLPARSPPVPARAGSVRLSTPRRADETQTEVAWGAAVRPALPVQPFAGSREGDWAKFKVARSAKGSRDAPAVIEHTCRVVAAASPGSGPTLVVGPPGGERKKKASPPAEALPIEALPLVEPFLFSPCESHYDDYRVEDAKRDFRGRELACKKVSFQVYSLKPLSRPARTKEEAASVTVVSARVELWLSPGVKGASLVAATVEIAAPGAPSRIEIELTSFASSGEAGEVVPEKPEPPKSAAPDPEDKALLDLLETHSGYYSRDETAYGAYSMFFYSLGPIPRPDLSVSGRESSIIALGRGMKYRYAAARLLGRIRLDGGARDLESIADDSGRPNGERFVAALALNIAGEDMRKKVVLALLDDEHELHMRLGLALALGRCERSVALPRLVDLMLDKNAQVRAAAGISAFLALGDWQRDGGSWQIVVGMRGGASVQGLLDVMVKRDSDAGRQLVALFHGRAVEREPGDDDSLSLGLGAFAKISGKTFVEPGEHDRAYLLERARKALDWWRDEGKAKLQGKAPK